MGSTGIAENGNYSIANASPARDEVASIVGGTTVSDIGLLGMAEILSYLESSIDALSLKITFEESQFPHLSIDPLQALGCRFVRTSLFGGLVQYCADSLRIVAMMDELLRGAIQIGANVGRLADCVTARNSPPCYMALKELLRVATIARMPEQVDLPKLYQVLAIPLQTALLIVQGTPLPEDAFPAGQMNTALIVIQALLKLCHWRRNGHFIDQSTDFVALLVVPISGPQLSTELRNIERGGLRFFHNQCYLAGTTLLTLESPNWFSE